MKLELKNIGKLDHASIDIDSITVIAGENDTGKSTVGKTLYSIFSSFHNLKNNIEKSRSSSIDNIILSSESLFDIYLFSSSVGNEIIERKDYFLKKENLYDFFLKKTKQSSNSSLEKRIDDINKVIPRIQEVLKISDHEFVERVLTNTLNEEFNYQINNIQSKNEAEVSLQIKTNKIEFKVNDDNVTFLKYPESLNLTHDIVYFDDPFILDDCDRYESALFKYAAHRKSMYGKIKAKINNNNIFDEILKDKKLSLVFEKLQKEGIKDTYLKDNTLFYGNKNHAGEDVKVSNLSSGLKSFVLIKILIQNGYIEQNGTIILDEPEIHLHPKWQVMFAEIIVMLQKELGLHILISTHSPYFLRALEVYAAKYGIADSCKYYLSKENGEFAEIVDVTEKTDRIYEKLSAPFQTLENEEWSDERYL